MVWALVEGRAANSVELTATVSEGVSFLVPSFAYSRIIPNTYDHINIPPICIIQPQFYYITKIVIFIVRKVTEFNNKVTTS